MTERHRKKWVDALSLVLPVLLFFAVLNCFTTYLYYQDYQCKMDILTEVAAGAETTGMDVAAGWLKGNDHQANEQGKQLLEQYGYWENKGTSFYVRFRQNIMITGCTSAVLCLSLLTFLFYRKKAEAKESRKRLEQLEQILIAFRENHFEVVPDTEDHVGQERLKFQLEAIINVLDNAIKYSPEHSKITIRLQKRTGFVRIEIEDQGIGIPQSEYHKIFQRFYRGTAPEVREKSGTGIGLYLSRQIIEQHGGTITVASGKVRKGSTFLIQLPENGLS